MTGNSDGPTEKIDASELEGEKKTEEASNSDSGSASASLGRIRQALLQAGNLRFERDRSRERSW